LSGTYLNRENNSHANYLTLEIAKKNTPRKYPRLQYIKEMTMILKHQQ